MSACMSGTRGSGVLSSTGDVLVRGVGGVCDMCMCLARGGVGGEGGEWMRELGLGFTNPEFHQPPNIKCVGAEVCFSPQHLDTCTTWTYAIGIKN